MKTRKIKYQHKNKKGIHEYIINDDIGISRAHDFKNFLISVPHPFTLVIAKDSRIDATTFQTLLLYRNNSDQLNKIQIESDEIKKLLKSTGLLNLIEKNHE